MAQTQRPTRPLQVSSTKTQYLILFNANSALAWLVVLARVAIYAPTLGFENVYPGLDTWWKWTQTLALLEVVHAALGIVRAPLFTTIMQVASRILILYGVVLPFPYLAASPAFTSMLIAHSVTEVIRYSYFTLSLSGMLPKFMEWLRYNTFFVLYPMGISSECWLIYSAIKPAGAIRPEFAYALYAILAVYVPGSYVLYTHMMKQRRKVMRGKKVEKRN